MLEDWRNGAAAFDLTVALHEPRWEEALPHAEKRCSEWMTLVLEAHAGRFIDRAAGLPVEAACILTDDAEIHEMNLRFRGKDAATNVLSFPAEADLPALVGAPLMLGDILISLSTLEHEARAQGKMLEHHTAHMVIHGMLHLLGFDHLHDADAESMEAEEIRLLAQLGIADPYTDEPEP